MLTRGDKIRVLIADDRQLLRSGLRALFCRTTDIACVGEASDGREAVELASRLTPDIVTMDFDMPRLDGLQATGQICAQQPNVRILIVAMSYDEGLVRRALECGARGYVTKLDMYDELVPAIRAVHSGQSYFSTRIASLWNGNKSP